jgi:hypothetical protein
MEAVSHAPGYRPQLGVRGMLPEKPGLFPPDPLPSGSFGCDLGNRRLRYGRSFPHASIVVLPQVEP